MFQTKQFLIDPGSGVGRVSDLVSPQSLHLHQLGQPQKPKGVAGSSPLWWRWAWSGCHRGSVWRSSSMLSKERLLGDLSYSHFRGFCLPWVCPMLLSDAGIKASCRVQHNLKLLERQEPRKEYGNIFLSQGRATQHTVFLLAWCTSATCNAGSFTLVVLGGFYSGGGSIKICQAAFALKTCVIGNVCLSAWSFSGNFYIVISWLKKKSDS